MFNIPRKRRQHNQREAFPMNNSFNMGRGSNHSFVNNRNISKNTFKQLVNKENLTNIAKNGAYDINKTLNNVQKVAKALGSATPIMQEYAPIVKNLPAMYRMIKAMNQIEDEEPVKDLKTKKTNYSTPIQQAEKSYLPKQSIPKLFFD